MVRFLLWLAIWATPQVQHSVTLSWQASPTPGVVYRVYRGPTDSGPWTFYHGGIPNLTYVDTNVTAGTTYCYEVRAFLASTKQESTGNPQVCATVPSP